MTASTALFASSWSWMDAFNVVAGVVTILSLIFAIWIYMRANRYEAVEQEKAVAMAQRLRDIAAMANASAQQASLIAALADREGITKKELKHLVLAQTATLTALESSARRIERNGETWKFGVPARYLILSDPTPNEAAANRASADQ